MRLILEKKRKRRKKEGTGKDKKDKSRTEDDNIKNIDESYRHSKHNDTKKD